MKLLKKLLLVILHAVILPVAAQQTASGTAWQAIFPDSLELSCSQTSSIVFPYDVVSADRGSRDLLVQKAKGTQNILQLKATQPCFETSNLSVVTADGALYTFTVCYNEFPVRTALLIHSPGNGKNVVHGSGTNAAEVTGNAVTVAGTLKAKHGPKAKGYGMTMHVTGVFVHKDVTYIRLNFTNTSGIDYDVEALRFYIKDQKKSKRTSSQELDIRPIYVYGETKAIANNSQHQVVIAVPKFTIPDKKVFCIQLIERNGGRHLDLKLKHRYLFRAVPINP